MKTAGEYASAPHRESVAFCFKMKHIVQRELENYFSVAQYNFGGELFPKTDYHRWV